jgi:hypothetical protein
MTSYASIGAFLDKLFNSYWFHLAVNVLVLANAVLIFTDLTLEYIELSKVERSFLKLKHAIASYLLAAATSNDTNPSEFNMPDSALHSSPTSTARLVIRIVMLLVLIIFMIEIILKLVFVPRVFLINKLEVFDSLFVLVSFVSTCVVIAIGSDIVSLVSLIMLTRLWRLTVLFKRNFPVISLVV